MLRYILCVYSFTWYHHSSVRGPVIDIICIGGFWYLLVLHLWIQPTGPKLFGGEQVRSGWCGYGQSWKLFRATTTKFQKAARSKPWICHTPKTIYITFTLMRYYRESRDDETYTGRCMGVICNDYRTISYKGLKHPWVLASMGVLAEITWRCWGTTVNELSWTGQTFSVKGPIVNILGLVGYLVSVAAAQLCCWSSETTT